MTTAADLELEELRLDLGPAADPIELPRRLTATELAPVGLAAFQSTLARLDIPAAWAGAVLPTGLTPGVGHHLAAWLLALRFEVPGRRPKDPPRTVEARLRAAAFPTAELPAWSVLTVPDGWHARADTPRRALELLEAHLAARYPQTVDNPGENR